MDWRIYAFCFIALMFFITYFHVESWRSSSALPHRRAPHPHDLRLRRRRAGRRAGRVRVAGAEPGLDLQRRRRRRGAARVFGVGLAGVGFFACFWSWVGFEMAPNYAEESRNPKKMMAAAIYISCIGLGHPLHVLVVDADQRLRLDERPVGLGGGERSTRSRPRTPAISPGNGHPRGQLRERLLPGRHRSSPGSGSQNLFQVLIITGSFACALAFWQTSNRYLFAMGREGILPRAPRPNAREAQEPVRRDVRRRSVRRRR